MLQVILVRRMLCLLCSLSICSVLTSSSSQSSSSSSLIGSLDGYENQLLPVYSDSFLSPMSLSSSSSSPSLKEKKVKSREQQEEEDCAYALRVNQQQMLTNRDLPFDGGVNSLLDTKNSTPFVDLDEKKINRVEGRGRGEMLDSKHQNELSTTLTDQELAVILQKQEDIRVEQENADAIYAAKLQRGYNNNPTPDATMETFRKKVPSLYRGGSMWKTTDGLSTQFGFQIFPPYAVRDNRNDDKSDSVISWLVESWNKSMKNTKKRLGEFFRKKEQLSKSTNDDSKQVISSNKPKNDPKNNLEKSNSD